MPRERMATQRDVRRTTASFPAVRKKQAFRIRGAMQRPDAGTDEPPNIRCVRLARGKPATNRTALGEVSSSFPRLSHSLADQLGCLMMFVDNVRVEDLLNIDPGAVELVVVLLPHEAGVLYGTGASRGVLLVYTKGAVR